jgi:hypothetical protein
MKAGRSAAGLGRIGEPQRTRAPGLPFRLDPFALPVRFAALDEAADQQLRIVDLHRERVVVRRSVGGMRMAFNLPLAAFRGVAIRRVADESIGTPGTMAVMLEHLDPALSLPLFAATQSNDIVAEWHCWGRVLGLPLLTAESDGALALARLGAHLRIETPTRRRRRRSAIARRRPARMLRRRPGERPQTPVVHRGEREIIARS